MKNPFAKAYPKIANWIDTRGWIEIGQDEYSRSIVRALDEGGLVSEITDKGQTTDEALQELEKELTIPPEGGTAN